MNLLADRFLHAQDLLNFSLDRRNSVNAPEQSVKRPIILRFQYPVQIVVRFEFVIYTLSTLPLTTLALATPLEHTTRRKDNLRLTSRYAPSRARNLDTWLELLLAEEEEDEDAVEEEEDRAAMPLSASMRPRRAKRRSRAPAAAPSATGSAGLPNDSVRSLALS